MLVCCRTFSLLLLKTKYGKVDSSISYIARRAELALYSQAHSVREYRNPQTLSRRLHALVVKLHMHNLAAREDAAVAAEEVALQALATPQTASLQASVGPVAASPRKRLRCPLTMPGAVAVKRQRIDVAVTTPADRSSCRLFFDGTTDLLQHVTTFLDARDVLRCSMASRLASRALPSFVSRIDVSVQALQVLAPMHRRRFFAKFPSLKTFALYGGSASHQPLQVDAQHEAASIQQNAVVRSVLTALSRVSLLKLERVRLGCAYMEGLGDRITCQVARVVLAASARFPLLQELSLCGNGIADDGIASLHEALVARHASDSRATHQHLRLLNIEQNFVGERGVMQLADAVSASNGALVVRMGGNLVCDSSSRSA